MTEQEAETQRHAQFIPSFLGDSISMWGRNPQLRYSGQACDTHECNRLGCWQILGVIANRRDRGQFPVCMAVLSISKGAQLLRKIYPSSNVYANILKPCEPQHRQILLVGCGLPIHHLSYVPSKPISYLLALIPVDKPFSRRGLVDANWLLLRSAYDDDSVYTTERRLRIDVKVKFHFPPHTQFRRLT